MELHWILYYFLFESYAVIIIIVMTVACLQLIKFISALCSQSSLSAKAPSHQTKRGYFLGSSYHAHSMRYYYLIKSGLIVFILRSYSQFIIVITRDDV